MSWTVNNGVRIRYEVGGAGPVILAHHGGGMRLESWQEAGWADQLTSSFQLVTFDARGHGESDKPTDPADYALDLMVGDVLAVADACGAGSFHYLGWSMGAKIGWGVAGFAQERLESLALIGADPEGSDDSAGPMIELIKQGTDVVAEALAQMWNVPEWAMGQYRDNDPQALLGYFRSPWPDLSHVPGDLETPTLLMCGSDDEVIEAMRRAAANTGTELVELEGEDHMTSVLSEEAIQAYLDFMRQAS